MHNIQGSFKCEVCPAKFKTQRGLDNHKCRWICKECGTKLRTKGGYERHIANHEKAVQKREDIKAAILEAEEERNTKIEALKVEVVDLGLFNPKYEIGDKVWIVTYYVTKPTHKRKFNRMVRVRYEEERVYHSELVVIHDVVMTDNVYVLAAKVISKEPIEPIYRATDISSGWVLHKFIESETFENKEDANEKAKIMNEAYKNACEFASSCR